MHGNRISWDSHGNVTDNDCVMGTGVELELWEWKWISITAFQRII